MKKFRAFYFSGTGNTKFVATYLVRKLSVFFDVDMFDITQKADFAAEISGADIVLVAFPIYGSSPPIPMRNFVHRYGKEFYAKTVAIAETQYFFSGDGSASLGRTLRKKGAIVKYAEHFNMPNNIADGSVFKVKNGDELSGIVHNAVRRLDAFSQKIAFDKKFLRGFDPVSHAVGYFCQRKWWRKGEKGKRSAVKVDRQKCVGCGICIKSCPVGNLKFENGQVVPSGNCVFCYRCVNLCPKRAITLFGSEVKNSYGGLPVGEFLPPPDKFGK